MPSVPSRPRPVPVIPEPLERRTLLSSSLSSFSNVNITRMSGNQAEGAIAADPTNPSRLFVATNVDQGDGLVVATSGDGGQTWASRLIANDTDNLPPACCDPSTAFDSFGNLFLSYINSKTNAVAVLISTDAGQSFSPLAQFKGDIDQPTLATGPGSVWVTFQKGNSVVATGAADTGPGAVGPFLPVQRIRGSDGGNFGDIAIGPSGQVIVTYQVQHGSSASRIFVNDNPGGLANPKFGKPILATTTRLADFDYIPAQPDRSVDAEAGLAFDRSGGPFNGRVYLVYTDESPNGSGNTDILLRYSDNQGATWSQPARVNDDTTLNSQFNPRVSEDDSTGNIAVSWYDARDDQGAGSPGDTNQVPNDDASYWATLVTPLANGLAVSPNQIVSAGVSNSSDANSDTDFGDYSGLSFVAGILHPLWFDNSDSTGDNPNGTLKDLNGYTASVPASAFAPATDTSLGGLSAPAGPLVALAAPTGSVNPGFVKRGTGYAITVSYSAGVSPTSLGDRNLLVTGPNTFSAPALLRRTRTIKGGALLATYDLTNPGGAWTAADDGTYTIHLQPDQVLDANGQASPGGILGTFAVASGHRKGSHSGHGGSRGHGDPDR